MIKLTDIIDKSAIELKTLEYEREKLAKLNQLNKRIQNPLPNEIDVSFQLEFKLNQDNSNQFDSIVKRNFIFKKLTPGLGYGINLDFIKNFINWSEWSQFLTIDFSKDYKTPNGFHSLFSLSNINQIKNKNLKGLTTCSYFPANKIIILSFENMRLERDNTLKIDNYSIKSVIDLKNTTLVLNTWCVNEMENVRIFGFQISSNELNIISPELNLQKTSNKGIFIMKVWNL